MTRPPRSDVGKTPCAVRGNAADYRNTWTGDMVGAAAAAAAAAATTETRRRRKRHVLSAKCKLFLPFIIK